MDVDRIIHDSVLTRPIDEVRVTELMASFKSKGQRQPIEVRPSPAGFRVTFGEHRLEAATRLKAKGIPIKGLPLGHIKANIEEVSENEALELKVTENAQRNEFADPWELGRIFAKLLREEYNGRIDDLSDALGKPASYIRDRTRVYYNLDPSLRVHVGHALTVANTIALAKYETKEQQLVAAQAIIATRTTNLQHTYGGGGSYKTGTVKVRAIHECTCGCGNIHPIGPRKNTNNVVEVDVGEGTAVMMGTVGRNDPRVHLENEAAQDGDVHYSYDGYRLGRRWVAVLPVGFDPKTYQVTENVKEPRDLCEVCIKHVVSR